MLQYIKKPKHEISKETLKEFDILDGCRTLVEQQMNVKEIESAFKKQHKKYKS